MQSDENVKLIKNDKEAFILHSNYINIQNAEKNKVKLIKAK
jgi:hypothetical protein